MRVNANDRIKLPGGVGLDRASSHLALDASWIAGIHPFDPLGRSTSVSLVLQHAAWKMLIAAKAAHIVTLLPTLFREVQVFLQRNAFAALPPSEHLEGSISMTDFTNWLDTIDPTSLPASTFQLVKVSNDGRRSMVRRCLTQIAWLDRILRAPSEPWMCRRNEYKRGSAVASWTRAFARWTP